MNGATKGCWRVDGPTDGELGRLRTRFRRGKKVAYEGRRKTVNAGSR